MWWRDGVIYQVYVRSFQDSDGDGIGDLPGVLARLDHVRGLGADALWLSPIHPSPQVDFGYDVSDFDAIDPTYGTPADFDALVEAAHARGLRVLMDLVIGHTSIEHPWFRAHPDRYIRAAGERAPNNWVSVFGGSAWSRDPVAGGWYLHTFHPEQPDLDWRNPEVVAAMQEVVALWRARGVDGFRLDAASLVVKDALLRDDPPASEPFPLPQPEEYGRLEHVRSAVVEEAPTVLAALREAVGDGFLVAEAFLPTRALAPLLAHVDAAFVFEFLYAPWSAPALARALEAVGALPAGGGRGAWVLSNHDFGRVASRVGPANARAAALLLLTLPGVAFLYQGDELGLEDGPGGEAAGDGTGREIYRHPMPWHADAGFGFTSGSPWLAVTSRPGWSVAEQLAEPHSMLALHRALIAARRRLRGELRDVRADGAVLSFRRGEHAVAVNTGSSPAPVGLRGTVELSTHPAELAGDGVLLAHAAVLLRVE